MRSQSVSFAVVLVLSAGAVGLFVTRDQTGAAFAAGVVGLLLHSVVSWNRANDDEVADSSYFFGFILTLVFLAAGLYKLGVGRSSLGGGAPQSAAGTAFVLRFLVDLAAGLGLTIVGLTIRQIRALSTSATSSATSAIAAQRELTKNLEKLVELWRERPEQQVLEQLRESRTITRSAAESLQEDVAAAGKRIRDGVAELETATGSATQTILRVASLLNESFTRGLERFQQESGKLLDAVQEQRSAAEEAVAASQQRAADLKMDADKRLAEHVSQWELTLSNAREALRTMHQGLDNEYKRGIEGFSSSAIAFEQLAARTVQHIQSLPDPATALAGLWKEVAGFEAKLNAAIDGSVKTLQRLKDESEGASDALGVLSKGAISVATAVDTSAEALRDSLARDLKHMNELLDEYVRVLQASTRGLRV